MQTCMSKNVVNCNSVTVELPFSSCTSHEVDEIECFIDKKLLS